MRWMGRSGVGKNGLSQGRHSALGLWLAVSAGIGWMGCESEPIHSTLADHNSGAGGTRVDIGSGGDQASTNTGGSGTTQAAGAAGESNETTSAVKLDNLVVTGVEIGLKPRFDPTTMRYSVLADEPAGDLVVTATAAEHLQIFVNGVAADSGTPVPLPSVSPGSEVEVEVTNDAGDRASYTLLYLPARFPDFGVTVRKALAATDPIYLATWSPESYFVVKLNNDGVPLFYRQTSRPCHDFKKHPTGQVSYSEFVGDPTVAEHIVMDETFTEVDRVRTVGLVDTDEHEFLIRPNGNYVVLAYEPVIRDLTEFGRGSAESIFDGIWQELSPDHEVLFEWNTWDHMAFDESVYLDMDRRDYSHMNSAFVDDDGNWIVSARGQAQVLKLDGTTGEVIWRFGGVQNDFTFVNDPYSGLCGQHTASILENGHLLLFDNGQHCYPLVPERGELTRIVEYELDDVAMTAELVWSYSRDDAYTVSQGSAQRLENGNTWIGWGIGTDLVATEVTPAGDVVFDLRARSRSGNVHSYRAWRFEE